MNSLQTMIDDRDIRHGLARFARVLDTKQWEALGEVFAADLSYNYGAGGEQQGIDELCAQMRRYLDICGATQHLLGSIQIHIDGDTALSRAYVQARHQGIGPRANAFFDSNGEYVDRWEKRPEGWRIVRREAIWFTHTGDPGVLGM